MPQEIEVKYLVNKETLPSGPYPHKSIRQGYIAIENENVVRIRQLGDSYFITIKGEGMMSRKEVEIEVRADEFEELWPMTAGRQIEKMRYYIDSPDYLVELDVFGGELEGLIVAEVEFDSEEDAGRFVPPVWFSREVTWDKRYQNSNLARYGKPAEN